MSETLTLAFIPDIVVLVRCPAFTIILSRLSWLRPAARCCNAGLATGAVHRYRKPKERGETEKGAFRVRAVCAL